MKASLEGIKIIDLTRLLPGPFCTMLLADYGAEVTKVEPPEIGDGMRHMGPGEKGKSTYFKLLNRNKKSITLNLKDQVGLKIFYKLIKNADVLVEGFRPGVVKKLAIDYATLKTINPSLIFCSITGYGQDGPYKDKAGHDLNYIALSGILAMTGNKEGRPAIPGTQLADIGGGSFPALFGILAALYYKEKTGQGQYIDISMLDGLLNWNSINMAHFLDCDEELTRGNTILTGSLACYSIYETKDGKYMSLGALEEKFWAEFCRAVKRPDLLDKQYQNDQEDLMKEVEEIFLVATREEWVNLFEILDVCCEPVLEIAEVVEHRQVKARKLINEVCIGDKKEKQLGFPVKMSQTPAVIRAFSPNLGQHTEEVLKGIGYDTEDINKYKEDGVI